MATSSSIRLVSRVNNRKFRSECRRNLSTVQLQYSANGDPSKVLELKRVDIADSVESDEVLVRMCAAPVNPADINQIQGVYPIKPKVPAVGGTEGYGVIEKVGDGVNNERLKVGDAVVPAMAGSGTWRSHFIAKSNKVFKVDKQLPLEALAQFMVNPPTAYRMLSDFRPVSSGDTVIQNGANSAVGRCAIQIAKIRGCRSINVIRARESERETQALREELIKLGAVHVVTEQELYRGAVRKLCKDGKHSHIKLALNCVGGQNALFLASCLDDNGVMVTYGGMSKQPVHCPTGPLIFKDIFLRGYWMSRWYERNAGSSARMQMYEELSDWIKCGSLSYPPCEKVKVDDFHKAISIAASGTGKKQLLVF